MTGLDEYFANKRVLVRCMEKTDITGHIVDESDLYYVMKLDSGYIFPFKKNIAYIEIINDEDDDEEEED